MTDDLVTRLRVRAEFTGPYSALWDDAADRIEKLEGQKEIYFNAFTKATVRIKDLEDALGLMVEYGPTTIEDLKHARGILDKKLTYYEAGFGKMVDEWKGRRAADRIEQLEAALRETMNGTPGWYDLARKALEGKDG